MINKLNNQKLVIGRQIYIHCKHYTINETYCSRPTIGMPRLVIDLSLGITFIARLQLYFIFKHVIQ